MGANKAQVDKIETMQPEKVTRRRELAGDEKEYYIDYIFSDDPQKGSKLLQFAKKWKSRSETEIQENTAKKPKTKKLFTDENEIDLGDI